MNREAILPIGQKLRLPLLYEDRSVLGVDKPPGWLLAPDHWENTGRNLQTALVDSIRSGANWATVRRIHYLRYVHRLDAGTTGVLVLAKSKGALRALSDLFSRRSVLKAYLAVVSGEVVRQEWTCSEPIAPDPQRAGCMRIQRRGGQSAETSFRLISVAAGKALVEARPVTGRTHQIRVHLAAVGLPILGDRLYSGLRSQQSKSVEELALRAVFLRYVDPFSSRRVAITAPVDEFMKRYGYPPDAWRIPPSEG